MSTYKVPQVMALQANWSKFYILYTHTPYNDIGVVANVAENWLESRLTTKIGLQQVMQDKH